MESIFNWGWTFLLIIKMTDSKLTTTLIYFDLARGLGEDVTCDLRKLALVRHSNFFNLLLPNSNNNNDLKF